MGEVLKFCHKAPCLHILPAVAGLLGVQRSRPIISEVFQGPVTAGAVVWNSSPSVLDGHHLPQCSLKAGQQANSPSATRPQIRRSCCYGPLNLTVFWCIKNSEIPYLAQDHSLFTHCHCEYFEGTHLNRTVLMNFKEGGRESCNCSKPIYQRRVYSWPFLVSHADHILLGSGFRIQGIQKWLIFAAWKQGCKYMLGFSWHHEIVQAPLF